jgi:hypothetical protein
MILLFIEVDRRVLPDQSALKLLFLNAVIGLSCHGLHIDIFNQEHLVVPGVMTRTTVKQRASKSADVTK